MLFFKFILMSSKENDIIYDLFMGSGIIVCVCMDLNRNYIGFEILSEYCEAFKVTRNLASKRIRKTIREIYPVALKTSSKIVKKRGSKVK